MLQCRDRGQHLESGTRRQRTLSGVVEQRCALIVIEGLPGTLVAGGDVIRVERRCGGHRENFTRRWANGDGGADVAAFSELLVRSPLSVRQQRQLRGGPRGFLARDHVEGAGGKQRRVAAVQDLVLRAFDTGGAVDVRQVSDHRGICLRVGVVAAVIEAALALDRVGQNVAVSGDLAARFGLFLQELAAIQRIVGVFILLEALDVGQVRQ